MQGCGAPTAEQNRGGQHKLNRFRQVIGARTEHSAEMHPAEHRGELPGCTQAYVETGARLPDHERRCEWRTKPHPSAGERILRRALSASPVRSEALQESARGCILALVRRTSGGGTPHPMENSPHARLRGCGQQIANVRR
jgi:hypothetical protein